MKKITKKRKVTEAMIDTMFELFNHREWSQSRIAKKLKLSTYQVWYYLNK